MAANEATRYAGDSQGTPSTNWESVFKWGLIGGAVLLFRKPLADLLQSIAYIIKKIADAAGAFAELIDKYGGWILLGLFLLAAGYIVSLFF